MKSKIFIRSVILVAILIAIILYVTNCSLLDYTKHNIEIRVPDLVGYTYDQAQPIVEKRNLNVIVNDSTFVKGKDPGVIMKQDPFSFSKVKEGRKIYVTVNTMNPPLGIVPNLKMKSVRQAVDDLSDIGVTVDANEPVPYFVNEVVLGAKYKGELLEPGQKIPRGSSVDLLVGYERGGRNQKVAVPNLIGLTTDEAKLVLIEQALNLGYIGIEDTLEDTLNARIYRQRPIDTLAGNIQRMVKIGEIVDVWITNDSTFFTDDSTQVNDTSLLDTNTMK